jgi:hypothetical protein
MGDGRGNDLMVARLMPPSTSDYTSLMKALLMMGMISIFLTLTKSTTIELWIWSRLCFHTSIQQRQKM